VVDRIVRTARMNNRKLGVTGVLFFEQGYFFQILEGQADVVRPLYEQIRRDPRHYDIDTLFDEPVSDRTFSDWSLGAFAVEKKSQADINLYQRIVHRLSDASSFNVTSMVGFAWTLVADSARFGQDSPVGYPMR